MTRSAWIAPKHPVRAANAYAAFRTQITATRPSTVAIRLFAPHFFRAWLNGHELMEGPARYADGHSEREERTTALPVGAHTLAVLVHHDAVAYRNVHEAPTCLWASVVAGDGLDGTTPESAVGPWRAMPLDGAFLHRGLRVSPNLGWVEEHATDLLPADWWMPGFDDSAWPPAAAMDGPPAGYPDEPASQTAPPVENREVGTDARLLSEGTLRGDFDLYPEDLAWGFATRDLDPPPGTQEGRWRVYDLGRTRLHRPVLPLELPPGSEVQVAYSERLRCGGHVQPVLMLSNGPSCHLDRFLVPQGGSVELSPVNPKGARFVEVQVFAPLDPGSVRFGTPRFLERCSLPPEPLGAFRCGDAALERVWRAGWETLRGCAEDALTDCPSRERGQWTGDTVAVGMELLAALSGDLRLARRALRLCAQSARPEDGLIPARCPGFCDWQSGYPLVFTAACVRHHEITGDLDLLYELWPAAARNLALFRSACDPDGRLHAARIGANYFLDWGYMPGPDEPDLALHLQYLAALKSAARWARLIGRDAEVPPLDAWAATVRGRLQRWIGEGLAADGNAAGPAAGWAGLGYHAAILTLREGLLDGTSTRAARDRDGALAHAMGHLMDCFPNTCPRPRLSAPQVAHRRLITPYFAHFALDELIRRGQTAFVHDQWRRCWDGYLLADGRTTLMELFDESWSHCHHWSGSPSWQMSRHHLGLWPRGDLGPDHWELRLTPGPLAGAEGAVPFPDGSGARIAVEWRRDPAGTIRYQAKPDRPITLHMNGGTPVAVDKVFEAAFDGDGAHRTAKAG